MLNKNSYIQAGLGLIVAGALVALSARFVLGVTWLLALGICMLILAVILLALGRTVPRLPPEVCSLLLETGFDNIDAIVEELGIRASAIYLPSSLTGGRPQALIPLHSSPVVPAVRGPIPKRLIVRYGATPDDVGLLLSTAGSAAAGMLEAKPSASAAGLEEALNTLFVGTLGVANRVRVTSRENRLRVEVQKPRIEDRRTWSNHCLGGPLASIVACVAAEAWGKPVIIKQEERIRESYYVEVEVVP